MQNALYSVQGLQASTLCDGKLCYFPFSALVIGKAIHMMMCLKASPVTPPPVPRL